MQMNTLASKSKSNNNNKKQQNNNRDNNNNNNRQQRKQGEQQRVNTRIVIFIIRVIYERALPLCHLAVTVNGRKQRGIKHFTSAYQ